jgi:hypothetical protein
MTDVSEVLTCSIIKLFLQKFYFSTVPSTPRSANLFLSPSWLPIKMLTEATSPLHHQALMMEAVSTSETSVNLYETTRCNIPGECHLHTLSLEKIKSQGKIISDYIVKWNACCLSLQRQICNCKKRTWIPARYANKLFTDRSISTSWIQISSPICRNIGLTCSVLSEPLTDVGKRWQN